MGVEHFATPLCDPPLGFRQNAKFFLIFTWKRRTAKIWQQKSKADSKNWNPLLRVVQPPLMGVEHSQPLLLTSHRGVAKKAKKSKKGGRQKKADSKIKGGKQKGGQQNKIKNGQLNKSGQQKKKGGRKIFKKRTEKISLILGTRRNKYIQASCFTL